MGADTGLPEEDACVWALILCLSTFVAAGMETIPGVDVLRYNFKETLPQEVLTKMCMPSRSA
jgi:hypothetical protein